MFLGVEYVVDGDPVRVLVDQRDRAVPVATRGGGRLMVMLGQGEEFTDHSPGHFRSWPDGNTVSLEMLKNPTGMWYEWSSCVVPVKIAVARFYDNDALGYMRAHDLKRGEYLQGALLKKKIFERVYFVVVPEPGAAADQDRWWPRVVGAVK